LDIKGPHVVKPVHTEALRIVGDPRSLALRYYREGADEIIYMDIVASLYQRAIDIDQLRSVSDGIFIPLTVGGGIRTIQDINHVLRAGADKVAINTHATKHPEFLTEAARMFGSQCIILSIEAKQKADGTWEAYTDGGREPSGLDVVAWARQGISRGVGELMITSIDYDGTRKGYDHNLIRIITSFSPIPVIAHGGAGSPASVAQVILESKADAISASSIFHYEEQPIPKLKTYLHAHRINVRT